MYVPLEIDFCQKHISATKTDSHRATEGKEEKSEEHAPTMLLSRLLSSGMILFMTVPRAKNRMSQGGC